MKQLHNLNVVIGRYIIEYIFNTQVNLFILIFYAIKWKYSYIKLEMRIIHKFFQHSNVPSFLCNNIQYILKLMHHVITHQYCLYIISKAQHYFICICLELFTHNKSPFATCIFFIIYSISPPHIGIGRWYFLFD